MAATRATVPAAALRRDLYVFKCPNCGARWVRDGRRGARNLAHACNSACFAKARQGLVARGMLAGRNAYSAVWRHAPAGRGNVT